MGSRSDPGHLKQLQHLKEQPEYLQFNKFIITGYRPVSGVQQCLHSMLKWHNQSLDIYTHFIPLLVILWSVFIDGEFLPWERIEHKSLAVAHTIACIAPFVGSTLYHLLMSYNGGELFYRRLLQFDMVGVWTTQTFGSLSGIYTGLFCFSVPVQACVLIAYATVSLAALALALNGRNIWSRMAAFSAQFATRLAFLGLRLITGRGNPASIGHVAAMDCVALIGGFVNAFRWPERWTVSLPLGGFRRHLADHVLTSHQLMHLLVTWGIWHMHQAAVMDLLWMADEPSC